MALTETQKFRLRKFVKELSKYKGRHTELVSVYIPQGYDINKIIQHLAQEQGTASNIKSTATRKNVIAALEKMIQHLRLFKRTPDNGLAVFSGNVAEAGKEDFKVWSVEPPVPLKTRIYRCDKEFVLDLLGEMLEAKEAYGLIVIDRRDANIALLKGKSIVPLVKTHSEVPGKFKAGGQCIESNTLIKTNNKAIPISRLEIGDKLFSYDFEKEKITGSIVSDKWEIEKSILYKITAENAVLNCSAEHLFFIKKNNGIEEIPAERLNVNDTIFFVNGNNVKEESKIVEIKKEKGRFNLVDISVRNQNFIANGIIVHNSAARFARQREGAYKEHFKKVGEYVKEQFLHLKGLKGIIVGGPGPTKYEFVDGDFITTEVKSKIIAIKDLSYTGEFGLEELIEKSQDVLAQESVTEEKKIIGKFLETLATNPNMASYGEKETVRLLKMGAVDTLLLSEELDDKKIEEFEEEAKKYGTTVKILSTETREGVQLRDFGKVGALLRYEHHG